MSSDDIQAPDPGLEKVASLEQPSVEQAASEQRLADRLNRLETEKVFQRALELEQNSEDATETFSPRDLERIAREIGINPEFVRQAIVEVRSGLPKRSRLDRWLIPVALAASESIEGPSREELEARITKWMTEYEGLIPSGRLSDGAEWQVNRSVVVRMRTALTTGGNRMSRTVSGPIRHHITTVDASEHLVTVSAGDDHPLLLAKAGAATGVAIGAGTIAGSVALGEPWVGIVFGPLMGGGVVAGSVLGARLWAANMKRALRRSLTGLGRGIPAPTLPWRSWMKRSRGRKDS